MLNRADSLHTKVKTVVRLLYFKHFLIRDRSYYLINETGWVTLSAQGAGNVMTIKISNTDKIYSFETPRSWRIRWHT